MRAVTQGLSGHAKGICDRVPDGVRNAAADN
jgi:hypothetical protein